MIRQRSRSFRWCASTFLVAGRAGSLFRDPAGRRPSPGRRQRDADPQLVAGFPAAEFRWIVTHERVTHLEDLVQRRTLLAFAGRITRAVLCRIARIVAPVLDWPADRVEAEIEATARLLTERHRVRLDAA